MMDFRGDVTRQLAEWASGRPESAQELFQILDQDLRRLAAGYMRRERPDHTLQATALVNEAYIRIFGGEPFRWENRKHLFCAMAQTMRRILIDHARTHQAGKRGGAKGKLSLDEAFAFSEQRSVDLIDLDETLERLMAMHPRQGRVVEMRFFVGLTTEETASVLGVSPETVKLDWRFAKAWLQREIQKQS
jgi:RNA polymerase sigma-70 factor (ECF subfamily)